jgi:endonuclease/exonuclease/phosphatase (EEP) superfamily protein YafD
VAADEKPVPPLWPQIAKAVVVIGGAWAWLLLPHLGGRGEILAVAAPAFFFAVIVAHIVALFLRRRLTLVIVSLVVWLVSATAMIITPRTPTNFGTPRRPITIVAANLHFSNREVGEAARDVNARGADIVVISENTSTSQSVLTSEFPYHTTAAYRGYGYSQFIGSHFPLRRLPVPNELREALVVEVMAPTPFVLVGVHLPRAGINFPHLRGRVSFADQRAAVDAVIELTKTSTLPVVVAGDLNVSDRTAAYRRLVSHRRDAMRADWAGSTYRPFPWSLFELRIDHVIIDPAWCARHARRFHPAGSDHEAVQVAIGPCR